MIRRPASAQPSSGTRQAPVVRRPALTHGSESANQQDRIVTAPLCSEPNHRSTPAVGDAERSESAQDHERLPVGAGRQDNRIALWL
jgi:hypothetical protein